MTDAVYSDRQWYRRTTDTPNRPGPPGLTTNDEPEAGRLLDAKGNVIKIVHYREKLPFGFCGSQR